MSTHGDDSTGSGSTGGTGSGYEDSSLGSEW